jgi:tetratricopeptide (TPR) repeat protein
MALSPEPNSGASGLPKDAQTLLDLGNQARRDERSEEAHHYLHQSLEAATAENNKRLEGEAHLALAKNVLHYNPEEDSNAFDCLEWHARRALETFQECDDQRGLAAAMRELALVVPYEESLQMLEESGKLSRKIGDAIGVAECLLKIGQMIAMNGDQERGLIYVRESLDIARKENECELVALILCAAAIQATDAIEKLAYCEEAMTLNRQLHQRILLRTALYSAALLYKERGDYAKQEACELESLAIDRELSNVFSETICLNDLAEIARRRGDFARAEQWESQRRIELPEPPALSEAEQDLFFNGNRDEKLDFIKRFFN